MRLEISAAVLFTVYQNPGAQLLSLTLPHNAARFDWTRHGLSAHATATYGQARTLKHRPGEDCILYKRRIQHALRYRPSIACVSFISPMACVTADNHSFYSSMLVQILEFLFLDFLSRPEEELRPIAPFFGTIRLCITTPHSENQHVQLHASNRCDHNREKARTVYTFLPVSPRIVAAKVKS